MKCSVKNCTIPFHVTCAFEHSLELRTILDEGDEVKFKSYCLKHSKSKSGDAGLSPARSKNPGEVSKGGLRAQRLQELEEEFYTLIRLEELVQVLGLSERLVDFIYQYWKLKRKSSFNKALLPPKEEENLVLQPQEDSIHTRMRMFMHLRQDLERVRNLCYMVSRREKLKLLQSKSQEQMFNLHVKLMSQEMSAGLPASFPVENTLFHPPPRITLKLKMPKASGLGNGNPSSKSGPLCPDNSSNVTEHAAEGLGQGKPQMLARGAREERSNGRLSSSAGKPSGKYLALQAAIHGHCSNSNSKLDQDRTCLPKSNGVLEKMVPHKDNSCQTTNERDTTKEDLNKNNFRKSAMEHFGRSFKEATINLVRTTEDLCVSEQLSRKSSNKDKLWAKPVLQHKGKSRRSYQESDGYCPDLELSDSEPEARGRHRQQAGVPQPHILRKGKQSLGSRHTVQR